MQVEDFSLWYGTKQALFDVSMAIPKEEGDGHHRPVGLRQIDAAAVREPHERSDRRRYDARGDMKVAGDSIYQGVDVIELRKRMGMVFQKPNPFPMSIFENVIYPLRIDGERNKALIKAVAEQSLRGAALWDEVANRLHESASASPAGSSNVHRPGHCRRAGRALAR